MKLISFIWGGVVAAAMVLALVIVAEVVLRAPAPAEPAPAPAPVPQPLQDAETLALDAARDRAQETLDVFRERAEAPDTTEVSLKVSVPRTDPAEGLADIWMNECEAGGPADYVCTVGETSEGVALQTGDGYAFDAADIADWRVVDNQNRIYGAFSIRVMLPSMDPAEAQAIRARLAPLPLPKATE